MAEHNKTGKIGEQIVVNDLKRKKYRIIGRNYRKKWGEIDIIAEKSGITHFIEVKSTLYSFSESKNRNYRPEEKIDDRKIKRLSRAVQTYALESGSPLKRGSWCCDVCVVFIDNAGKEASIKYIKNILLPE